MKKNLWKIKDTIDKAIELEKLFYNLLSYKNTERVLFQYCPVHDAVYCGASNKQILEVCKKKKIMALGRERTGGERERKMVEKGRAYACRMKYELAQLIR